MKNRVLFIINPAGQGGIGIKAWNKLKVLLPEIATGTHIHEAGISYFQEKKIHIDSNPPAVLDPDGDIFGEIPGMPAGCSDYNPEPGCFI